MAGPKRTPAGGPGRSGPTALLESETVLHVQDLMTPKPESCAPGTNLADAAMIMWRRDCGIVPIVDAATRRATGVITDRDICMAVATKGRVASSITVDEVSTGALHAVQPKSSVEDALALMRQHKVRRLPVVDAAGVLQGLISLNDIVRNLRSTEGDVGHDRHVEETMRTIEAISEPPETKRKGA